MKTLFKLALKNILKNRLSFFIVFISLITGFTVCLFIGMYLQNELSYDKFHKKDNLYRVSFSGAFGDKKTDFAFAWAPLGPKIKDYFPEIIDYVRLYRVSSFKVVVKYEESKVLQDGLFYADQNIFKFFSFDLLSGNPETVLSEPNCAVITQKLAKQYFGNQDPIGKILEADDKEFVITGIVKSPPINSHIKFNILFSMASMNDDRIGPDKALESWRRVNYYTYLQFQNDESISPIKAGIQDFIKDELFVLKRELNVDIDLLFYHIEDIHLESHLDRELESNNSKSNIWILTIIGIFVFVISCVNFILITTNINLTRFTEVYVKKVMGQSKLSLMINYIIEIVIICFVCFLLTVVIFNLLLPKYNIITNSLFTIEYLFHWSNIIWIILILLFVGIIPGYFSGKILFDLKLNSTRNNPSSLRMFNSTIILFVQFSIAFTFIICTIVFNKQMSFIQNHELCYDKNNILLIHINDQNVSNSAENISEEFAKLAKVKSASTSSNHFANEPLTFAISMTIEGESREMQTNFNYVDYNFEKCYGLNMVEGRYFSKDFPADSFGVVVNQVFCKEMNLVNPIGVKMNFLRREYHIVGVVKDFHFSSFGERIEPYVMFFKTNPRRNNYISIKLNDIANTDTKKELEKIWSEVYPDNIFECTLFEDKLENRYQNDLLLIKLLKYLSFIVIIVALSGLLGQNFLILRLKRKEIAIRKVLGANFQNLLIVLTKKYMLVLLASWIGSCFISYFIIREWLNNFIFRFENQYLYYIFPILISISMSLLLISIRTFMSLKENPVVALKEE